MESPAEGQQPVAVVKLSRDEEDYLDKLLSEKKVVDATAGLDCTQKLINAGKSEEVLKRRSVLLLSP